ncbi:sulfate transporter CysZ [Erwinia sp. OLTSP20]|uniref:sulfate transporter CysZ n=1 Tax=unclassified Erwinia TaxID=2622719 RepID=UPI000C19E789|nr:MULTISPECIES: sulfate transporter CysZ [unclassified Erwinia]PIJ51552.1 sulfate transporter CysZ [Erwinia sp. OAMSP11]PIJ75862.1 sulfate transporter CysZ [Erwinia sp. OLSSP12]PIJ83462.1 sulfate transporter CysZ [Erwinia sp. OLCASP19]PIJ86295.1 sulfate transporter CysZ [Erwinia sp. OLMTSP26]PIJ88462.1 sulfate transporter CysZ [Erwinia sp. OLMDSP33]
MVNRNPVSVYSGSHYFFQGWKLIRQPGIRRYVLLPLLVNILLMGGAFLWLFHKLNSWIPLMLAHVPGWLQWLSYLLWPLTVISMLLVFSYFFSTLANWIAAPFCGLLAEQLEAQLTGESAPDISWMEIVKDTPRILWREWQKFAWYLPRALVLLLLYFIPGIGQTLAPVLWFLFSAWMLTIHYCDYAFDNHRIDFPRMRKALRQYKSDNMQFGALVSFCTLIPLLNLVIMPVAVCGATAMWVDKYRTTLSTQTPRRQ